MEELGKVNASTRQALMMAQDAAQRGDTDKAREYNQTAEAFANRLIATENQVNDLKTLSLQSAQAADQAARRADRQVSKVDVFAGELEPLVDLASGRRGNERGRGDVRRRDRGHREGAGDLGGEGLVE